MLPPAVIDHLDIRDAVVFGFLTRGVITVRRPFALSAAEKPLGHGVVKPIPLATPTPDDSMGRQQVAIRLTGLWTPAVCMVHQPCCGPTTAERHL
jgi:hypothetical protein